MKNPLTPSISCRLVRDTFLVKILKRSGAYYQSGDFFFQRLWHQRLSQIGFRVVSVEKLPYHHLWDIRLYGTLTAQSYLLLSKPVAKLHSSPNDLVLHQFRLEIQQIAKDLGSRIGRDCIHVGRKGAYFRVSFLWQVGRPGRWVKPEKKAEAFSFLIRPWLRRNRN
jgi:hypothetical protein